MCKEFCRNSGSLRGEQETTFAFLLSQLMRRFPTRKDGTTQSCVDEHKLQLIILIWGTPILLNKGWPKKSHVLQGLQRVQIAARACARGGQKKPILKCISTFSGKEEMDFSTSFFGPPRRREGGVPAEVELKWTFPI